MLKYLIALTVILMVCPKSSLAQLYVPTGDEKLDLRYAKMVSSAETFILSRLKKSSEKLNLDCDPSRVNIHIYSILEIKYPRDLKKCVDQMTSSNSKKMTFTCRSIVLPFQFGHSYESASEVIANIESKNKKELGSLSKDLAEQIEGYYHSDDFTYDADIHGCIKRENGQEYFIFSRGIIGKNSRFVFEKRRSEN